MLTGQVTVVVATRNRRPGLCRTLVYLAALPERPPIERFYLDLEASPLGDLVEAHGGFMHVPEGPGLGIDVDEAVLRKYRTM